MKKVLIPALIFLSIFTLAGCKKFYSAQSNNQKQSQDQLNSNYRFENPKKSAHYESNTPDHASVLAGVPINVVINFNFDLAKPSEIKITKDGKEYAQGGTTIDPNKLSMRTAMNPTTPDGLYTVNYKACWSDGSCHDGSFQFAIDKSQSKSFVDMTDKKEVIVDLKNIMFEPKNVRISKGTKVTWTNSDSTTHYVNTDSHPAHTYVLDMNSKELRQGQSFTYTFDQPGIYPYHCSAHAQMMTANIFVE